MLRPSSFGDQINHRACEKTDTYVNQEAQRDSSTCSPMTPAGTLVLSDVHMIDADDQPMSSTHHDPEEREACIDLGVMKLQGKTAHLYACERLVIARFVDPPGETRAKHMHALSFESDVFLLAAFRLYLDRVGVAPLPEDEFHDVPSLEC